MRHFRQVIPNTGCRKQQPYWAGLSALDPEQDASSLHPDKGLPPLTRAGSFTPGTPDNGHCIPLDPCPGKTEILRSCPQRILSVSPVFPKLPSREWAALPLRKKSAGIHPRFPSKAWLSSGCTGSAPLHDRLAAGTQRASPLSIAAVHHRDAGTGCTLPRLTGKTKTASFRLSTTVGRLCFGHYDISFIHARTVCPGESYSILHRKPRFFLTSPEKMRH